MNPLDCAKSRSGNWNLEKKNYRERLTSCHKPIPWWRESNMVISRNNTGWVSKAMKLNFSHALTRIRSNHSESVGEVLNSAGESCSSNWKRQYLYAPTMWRKNIESTIKQRNAIKFCGKLKKSLEQTNRMIREACGESSLSYWIKAFKRVGRGTRWTTQPTMMWLMLDNCWALIVD